MDTAFFQQSLKNKLLYLMSITYYFLRDHINRCYVASAKTMESIQSVAVELSSMSAKQSWLLVHSARTDQCEHNIKLHINNSENGEGRSIESTSGWILEQSHWNVIFHCAHECKSWESLEPNANEQKKKCGRYAELEEEYEENEAEKDEKRKIWFGFGAYSQIHTCMERKDYRIGARKARPTKTDVFYCEEEIDVCSYPTERYAKLY